MTSKLTVAVLLGLFGSTQAAQAPQTPGIHYLRQTTPTQQVLHLLYIDPTQIQASLQRPKSAAQNRASVATIAEQHQAIAAINGGFFVSHSNDNGAPAGILKINDTWHGIAYRPRGAVGWSLDQPELLFDRLHTSTRLKVGKKRFKIHGFNTTPRPGRITLYTPGFGRTLQASDGWSAIVEGQHVCRIIPPEQAGGPLAIPAHGMIYHVHAPVKQIPNIHPKERASLDISIQPSIGTRQGRTWQRRQFILGGSPLLIKEGKPLDFSSEKLPTKFHAEPHARTAIGRLADGRWLVLVAEHNVFLGVNGLTLTALVQHLLKLGCTDALNLDGGSSSTLYLNKKVIYPQLPKAFAVATPHARVTDAIVFHNKAPT